MSLLLDALQKARQNGDVGAAAVAGPASEASIPVPDWSIDEPQASKSLDGNPAASPSPPVPGAPVEPVQAAPDVKGPVPPEGADRQYAAQRIVEAAVPTTAVDRRRHRLAAWIGIGGGALGAAAVLGWWFWHAVHPASLVVSDPAVGASSQQPSVVVPTPSDTPVTEKAAAEEAKVAVAGAAEAGAGDAPRGRAQPPVAPAKPRVTSPARSTGSAQPRSAAEHATGRTGVSGTAQGTSELKIERDGWAQWLSQAQAAAARGDWLVAQERYEAVLSQQRNQPQAWLGLAVALHRQQRWQAALQAYERAVQLLPNEPAARYGWAVVLARVEPDRAEREMQDWLAQQPADGGVWMALGMLYARQSRWGLAIQALQRAVEIAPQRVEAIYNWAVALDHAGRTSEALAAYQRALSGGLEPGLRAQVQRRVQDLRAADLEEAVTNERGG